jgi:hypothetical protein
MEFGAYNFTAITGAVAIETGLVCVTVVGTRTVSAIL